MAHALKVLWLLLALAGLLYMGLCVLLAVRQRALLYYPSGRAAAVPVQVLHSQGQRLLVSTGGDPAGQVLVLYFGGNAEDVSAAVAPLADTFPGAAIQALHYRGYGGSSGRPSEQGLMDDARALYAQAAPGRRQVVVIGRSLGSGVAVQLAAAARVDRLVLVTPYQSIAGIAAAHFRYLPVRWLLRDRWDSGHAAPAVRAPVTLVMAGHDQVVPNWSTRALLGDFRPGQARLVVIDQADHNDIATFPAYRQALAGAAP